MAPNPRPGMMLPVLGLRSTKRILDMLLGGVGLLATAPMMLLAAIAIALDDGAPVLFRQERVGLHGEPFTVFKLRTMRDGKVTRVGRWLRRTGLDEIPQLLNVLRGDMTLVGPRPLTASEVRRLGWDHPRFALRFEVAPGLTGPVQVLGAVSAADSATLERVYVRRGGLDIDLVILGATAAMFIAGRDRVQRVLRRALRSHLEAWARDEGSEPAPWSKGKLGADVSLPV